MIPGVFATCVLVAAACAPIDRAILAEIFYDASGDDSGFEFVELANPTSTTVSLAGVRLEAGDGSGAGRWSLRWSGGTGDTIGPGGRFVIGGARVVPLPQSVVSLELQNGPDAVRMVWPDGTIETVGYGPLEFSEYRCGEPAADVASGQSLARIPDDANSGSNSSDFRASLPSPGRANEPRLDAAWVPGALRILPEQPVPETPALLAGRVHNRGRDAIASGLLGLVATSEGPFGSRVLIDTRLGFELARGDTMPFEIAIGAIPEGKQRIFCRISLEGDEVGENDVDSLSLRSGQGPVELTEVQFHPVSGEGEWVELRNRSWQDLDLASFSLSDRSGTLGHPEPGRAPCPADSFAVLAQDRPALIARFPGIDSTRVWRVSPWPSLNNTNDASGYADAVVVRESDGVLAVRLDYSAAGVPAGVPIELRGEEWRSALEPLGSPLRPARALREIHGRFEISPRRLSGPNTGASLSWSLPWPRARAFADLYALSGARVSPVLPELSVPGRGERDWRPQGIGPGVYLLVFRARPEGGGEGLSITRVIRLEEERP